MVVHEIDAIFGSVSQPTKRHTELTGIPGIAVPTARRDHALGGHIETHPRGGCERLQRKDCGITNSVVVITSISHDIVSEERAAVVDDRLVPFQLVEGFHAELVGQALRDVEHIDRNQPLFDLSTRPAECCSVQGIDGVYAVTDKGTFAPAHYLLPKTDGPGQITNGIIVIDERVQNLRAG